MAQCQKCAGLLDQDFGVVTCHQCGEINFLDESPNASPSPVAANPIPDEAYRAPEIPQPQMPEPSGDSPMDLSDPVGSVTKTFVPSPQHEIKEIEEFGNQGPSTAETGTLIYDLTISGVDTLELRKALVENLKDAKFRWNVEELEAKIHNGTLVLVGITPLKASILVKKLRHLDLEVSWIQRNVYEAAHP